MTIDIFFAAIKDGTWHNIEKLSTQLNISLTKLIELSKFLSNYELIEYEENNQMIKLKPLWKLLLPIEREPKQTKPHLISSMISPRSSIKINNTQISNLSDVEIEVTLRVDDQIKEFTIDV